MPMAPIPWKRQKEIMAGYEGEWKGRELCLLSANSYGIRDGVKRNIFFLQRARMQKLINGSMRNVSRSGIRWPIMVHNIQSPALKQTRLPYIKISRICRHSRQSVVSNPRLSSSFIFHTCFLAGLDALTVYCIIGI